MATRRQRKVAELLHEELSLLLHRETKDPRLALITVTGVEITSDLRQAQVYFTVLGDAADVTEAQSGLTNAAGFLKHRVGQALSLRHVPDLTFKLDTSLENGMRIEQLLDAIRNKEANATDDQPEQDDFGST